MADQILSPGQVLNEALAPPQEEVWQENLNLRIICPDCQEDPPNFIDEYSSGDTVCASCGLVMGDRIIDTRSEWRTFSNDESGSDDPSRVGQAASLLFNGNQLETKIAFGDGGQRSRELNRAHVKLNQDKSKKTLSDGYDRIQILSQPLRLPTSVTDCASYLFKQTEDARAFKSKNSDAIVAGCLFIACRQLKVPRGFQEIKNATRVSKKEVGRTFKMLQKFFLSQKKSMFNIPGGATLPAMAESNTEQSATNAAEFCGRYCNALLMSIPSMNVAVGIAENIANVGSLAGRSPLSGAAASIYMASQLMGEPRTFREIAAVVGVSDGTIRTAYKLLYAEKDRFIKPEWLGEGKGDLQRLLP